MTEEKERAIDKAIKLIAKAESTEFEAEKIAFLQKAHEIMQIHMLSEWDLAVKSGKTSGAIIRKNIGLSSPAIVHLAEGFMHLASAIAKHTRCRIILLDWEMRKFMDSRVAVFGTEGDVSYFEAMFVNLKLHALQKIDPQYDHGISFEENVFHMKSAGLTWQVIAARCNKPFDKKDSSWITTYKRECKRRGEEPISANPKNYQYNFMEEYSRTINTRLEEIRRLAEKDVPSGTGLVLVDVSKKINEKINEEFSRLGKISNGPDRRYNAGARAAGGRVGRSADLGQSRVGNTTRGALNG